MSHIPQPRPVQLDCFDPNIVVGIVEESESIDSAEKEGRKVIPLQSKNMCIPLLACMLGD